MSFLLKNTIFKSRFLITIIIVIILVSLSSYYFFFRNWQTYENSVRGFSVSYPPSWQLGEQEVSNSGREFYSPDQNILCYAYGFENALISDKGVPQTLEEFIDWFTEDETITKILEREKTNLADQEAIRILYQRNDNKFQEAVYALNRETGLGLWCVFSNQEERENFNKDFNKIVDSFKITDFHTGNQYCQNLISGATEPLKDLQTFIDKEYTEVTITSRENWDNNKLPAQVLTLENDNYECIPYPDEFDYPEQDGDQLIQPEVKSVEWQCELKYQAWQYLAKDDTLERDNFNKQGYSCEEQECLNSDAESDTTILCAKL